MADIPTTFDIGGGASAGLSALQFVQSLLTGARTAVIQVENYTSLTLFYKGRKDYHGLLKAFPADTIEPGKANIFGAQNKGGSFMTGAEGYVYYAGSKSLLTTSYFGQDPLPGDTGVLGEFYLLVQWDLPFIGDPFSAQGNSASAQLTGGYRNNYKVRKFAGGGSDNVQFLFRLYEKDQIAGPQIADL